MMKKIIAGAGAVIALAFASSGVAHADTTTLPGAGYLAYLANTGQLQALLGSVPTTFPLGTSASAQLLKIPASVQLPPLPAAADFVAPALQVYIPPVVSNSLPAVQLPSVGQLPSVQQFIPPVFQAFIPPAVSNYLP